jgi:hypothetical protein
MEFRLQAVLRENRLKANSTPNASLPERFSERLRTPDLVESG